MIYVFLILAIPSTLSVIGGLIEEYVNYRNKKIEVLNELHIYNMRVLIKKLNITRGRN